MVYIQEAHASDMWQLPSNLKQDVIFASPRDINERGEVADACVRKLNIKVPALIDTFDNATDIAYTGWPDRLYVIDREGKVAHKSPAGPFGFHPKAMEESLRKVLE